MLRVATGGGRRQLVPFCIYPRSPDPPRPVSRGRARWMVASAFGNHLCPLLAREGNHLELHGRGAQAPDCTTEQHFDLILCFHRHSRFVPSIFELRVPVVEKTRSQQPSARGPTDEAIT